MSLPRLFISAIVCFCIALFIGSCGPRGPKKSGIQEDTLKSNKFNNDTAIARLLKEYTDGDKEREAFHVEDNKEDAIVSFGKARLVFQQTCVPCHNKNSYAPFSLTDYRSIRKRAKAIREALEAYIMPPWPVNEEIVTYCNSQDISDVDRALLMRWIDQGAKILPGEDQQTTISFERKDKPQLIVPAPVHHTITSDSDTYVCFVIDPGFETDTFVNAIAFFTDNPETLHHLTLFSDSTGETDSEPDCRVCTHNDILYKLKPIDSWAKGLRSVIYRNDIGYHFRKGTKFMLQTHYEGDGHKGKSEKSSLGFYFIPKPKHEIKWTILHNFDLFLPANKITPASIEYVTEKPITLIGIYPHMHFLSRKAEAFAITPDGERIALLDIPYWDYLLQTKYVLEKPITLPAQSKIYMNAVFDNTSDNPYQPNFPIRDVVYELTAYDEMLVLGLFYVDQPIDTSEGQIARILE